MASSWLAGWDDWETLKCKAALDGGSVKRDDRGEYIIRTMERRRGEPPLECIQRDCGDYYEFTPHGVLGDHPLHGTFGCVGTTNANPELVDKLLNPKAERFPTFTFKIPKKLPADSTEKSMAISQCCNAGGQKVMNAIRKSVASNQAGQVVAMNSAGQVVAMNSAADNCAKGNVAEAEGNKADQVVAMKPTADNCAEGKCEGEGTS